MFRKDDLLEMQAILGEDYQIGFSWVFDDRAVVRSEYAEALQCNARETGFGERWTGFSLDQGVWRDGVLSYWNPDWPGQRRPRAYTGELPVCFNHELGSLLPEAVLAVARTVGLAASWEGEGSNWRPDPHPKGAKKIYELGQCVILTPGRGYHLPSTVLGTGKDEK